MGDHITVSIWANVMLLMLIQITRTMRSIMNFFVSMSKDFNVKDGHWEVALSSCDKDNLEIPNQCNDISLISGW